VWWRAPCAVAVAVAVSVAVRRAVRRRRAVAVPSPCQRNASRSRTALPLSLQALPFAPPPNVARDSAAAAGGWCLRCRSLSLPHPPLAVSLVYLFARQVDTQGNG